MSEKTYEELVEENTKFRNALNYICSPTMGYPGGPIGVFLRVADEGMVRGALATCIRGARIALGREDADQVNGVSYSTRPVTDKLRKLEAVQLDVAQAWHEGVLAGQHMQHLIETGENPWPEEYADGPYGVPEKPWVTDSFNNTVDNILTRLSEFRNIVTYSQNFSDSEDSMLVEQRLTEIKAMLENLVND